VSTDLLHRLASADLEIEGRLVDASNATLVATFDDDGSLLRCVYKPVAGERPLWDFPDGTLGRREVAAFLVSDATGWDVVPLTTWREDGPFGPGMAQLWVTTDDEQGLVDIVSPHEVPEGWCSVLDAFGRDGEPVVLVHADHPALRRMALFDIVVNNADRKGGHVLQGVDGQVRGVDHGVAFNVDEKLRTVLWGWAGEPIEPGELADLGTLLDCIDGDLGAELCELLSPAEVARTRRRVERLLSKAKYPLPGEGWPSIPWPAF